MNPERPTPQNIDQLLPDPDIEGQYPALPDQSNMHLALRSQLQRQVNDNLTGPDNPVQADNKERQVKPEFGEPAVANSKRSSFKVSHYLQSILSKTEHLEALVENLSEITAGIKKHHQETAASPELSDDTSWPDIGTYLTLEKGEYTPEELAAFIHEVTEGQYHSIPVLNAIALAPNETLQAIYHSSNLSGDLKGMFERSPHLPQTALKLAILQKVYDRIDPLDLFEPDSAPARDPIVQKLLDDELIEFVMTGFLKDEKTLWPEITDLQKMDAAKRGWGDRFLAWAVGLPKAQRGELQFASYSRTSNLDTGFLSSRQFESMLNGAFRSTHGLGIDQIKKLRDQAGIVNFDYYEAEQLKQMSALLNGDPAVIKHLQDGDTTVIMSDAKGDYNGALRETQSQFETESQRTLVFEINRPSDFYRHMLLLNRLGVRPSTLVLAAHGLPGLIKFGKGEDAFRIFSSNFSTEGSVNQIDTHLLDAKGLPKMVQAMMQDSRGIDDNLSAIGRRRIILKSCYQAEPVLVVRHRPFIRREQNGAIMSPGKPIDMPLVRRESTAETIAKQVGPNVDVYAGHTSLLVDRTPNGIKLSSLVDTPKGLKFEPLDTTHTYIDRFGKLVTKRIQRVVLRRKSDKDTLTGTKR